MLLISYKFIHPINQYLIIAHISGYLMKIKPIRWHKVMAANKYIGLIKKMSEEFQSFQKKNWVTWVNTLLAD